MASMCVVYRDDTSVDVAGVVDVVWSTGSSRQRDVERGGQGGWSTELASCLGSYWLEWGCDELGWSVRGGLLWGGSPHLGSHWAVTWHKGNELGMLCKVGPSFQGAGTYLGTFVFLSDVAVGWVMFRVDNGGGGG